MALTEEEPQEGGVPEWVVTFGDMMSLLLTFFIMLFSMSEIKEEQKYQAMMDALRKRFGHDRSIASLVPGQLVPRNSALAKLASMGRARRLDLLDGGDRVRAPVGDHPRVRTIAEGDHTTTGGVIYFDPGSSQLTGRHRRTLEVTAQQLGGKPQKMELRGHTSARPLGRGSPFKSHWDLAFDRCRRVKDYLVELGIRPERIRIAVAAANEPKHAGSDPILQRENDRVVISSLNEFIDEFRDAAGSSTD